MKADFDTLALSFTGKIITSIVNKSALCGEKQEVKTAGALNIATVMVTVVSRGPQEAV